MGTWQLLEGTARQYGLTITPTVDERCDVAKATEAACRYLKAAYEKYASKGFEVISISTDRKLKPWRAAVEELGMNWVQLLDVDASDIYGIHAIPRTFLVDPTGIVIDKNLRGEKLEEALSKLFE